MHVFQYLDSFSWAAGSTIVIVVFIAFSIIGTLIVRKFLNQEKLKNHHDVAGIVFANLGVLYAVLLGFTVVNVQQRFDKMENTTQQEASFLAELYEDAQVFSEKDRQAIRTAIKSYTKSVIDEEWGKMSNGERCFDTIVAFRHIWHTYYDVHITDTKQKLWYAESISKLNQLINVRLARILGSNESLGSEMWWLLFLGAIVMIAFVWVFGMKSPFSHLIMVSTLAASIAFLLYLIYSLDTAFSGSVSVQPDAFIRVLESFNTKY